ncbi:MAG: hypothetical protein JW953_22550 [Anaerolineae bacterium]|nr:hypothetical protein [Anaerolineae bacterium]
MKNRKTILPKYNILFILAIFAIFWLVQLSGAMAAPPAQGEDLAIITSPASNAVIGGVVQITGSADHPSFQFYILEFAPEPVTGDQWQIIGDIHQEPVINGVLETWETMPYPDGSYTVRLRVVRLDGNYSEYFAQQVVISNVVPTPTDTPSPAAETPFPTATPTEAPPTPTIVIDQPVVDTPTPRPVETSAPLEDPEESKSFIPTVTGFSLAPLRDTCFYGAGIMLGIFLLFGFLSVLRIFIMGFVERIRRYRGKK